MSLQQITYAFKSPTGLVRTVVLMGENLPYSVADVFWIDLLIRTINRDEFLYVRRVPVPDAPPRSLDDETLAKVRETADACVDASKLNSNREYWSLRGKLERLLPPASIVAMIDELTALRARVGGEVAQ